MNARSQSPSFHRPPGVFFWLVWFVAITGGVVADQDLSAPAPPFHIAFSGSMFTDINVNDAKAALKAWSVTVAKERQINTDPEPLIVDDTRELAGLLRSNRVDAVEMTVAEYATLSQVARFDPLFVASTKGQIAEEFVVLVHRDSPIKTLADLQGRHLNLYAHYRAGLARTWLDIELVQAGLPAVPEFLGQLTPKAKLSQVILPVFFRQVDACLVTRSGFEIMTELNPQTGKQLKVIAESPGIVPAVFCFRADVPEATKEPYIAGLRELHQHASGQQVLTIFHREKLEEHPASCLQSALELVSTHRRLCEGTNPIQVATRQPDLQPEGKEGPGK